MLFIKNIFLLFHGIKIQILVMITNLIIYLIILTVEVSLYCFWTSINSYTRAELMKLSHRIKIAL